MCEPVSAMMAFASLASAGTTIADSMKSAGPDPAKERAAAEAEAAQRANGKISMQRKAMRDNSLLTGAGNLGGMASTGKASAGGGRTTLGV